MLNLEFEGSFVRRAHHTRAYYFNMKREMDPLPETFCSYYFVNFIRIIKRWTKS
jgi:hypothetical protein